MFKTLEHFSIALFDLMLGFIVFANLLGWSNAMNSEFFNNAIFQGNQWLWGRHVISGEVRVYYFGFSSIMKMISAFSSISGSMDVFGMFNIGSFVSYLQNIVNYTFGNIPNFIQSLLALITQINTSDASFWQVTAYLSMIIDLALALVKMLAAPFILLGYSFMAICCLLNYAITALAVFCSALGGAFNAYMVNPMEVHSFLSSANAVIALGCC